MVIFHSYVSLPEGNRTPNPLRNSNESWSRTSGNKSVVTLTESDSHIISNIFPTVFMTDQFSLLLETRQAPATTRTIRSQPSCKKLHCDSQLTLEHVKRLTLHHTLDRYQETLLHDAN
jgi:hypothetical protein